MNIADFFFDLFSTISKFSIFPKKAPGPGASEKPFGPSGGVREGIWGHPGGVREASWEILGLSGESGGRLGRVLGTLGAILERPLEQSDFASIF